MSADSTTTFSARTLQASLTVKDLEKSLAWYRDVVGFSVDQKHERAGKLMAVSLKAGDVRILINQDDGAKGFDRVKGEGFSLQLTTDQNLDEIARRIKSHGSKLEAEARAVRERAGIIDLSSFGKIAVEGPGALGLLQRVSANDIDRPVGSVVYTQWCDERGGIVADVTVTRIADDRFRVVTGAGYLASEMAWLRTHASDDEVARWAYAVRAAAGPLRPAPAMTAVTWTPSATARA